MVKYDTYVDIQTPYVGEIPSHWKMVQNKRVMHKEKRICESYNGQNIISLTLNGAIVRDLGAGGKMPATFDGYQHVYPGELLMCLFDIDVTPRCVGRVNNEGLTSPAYSSFVLHDNANLGYYYYYYLMLDHTKELLHLAKNLRHSLTEEQIGQIKVPLPPIPEQEAIADYLDRETDRIDSIIAEAKDSIEEYKAWKASIIYEAVTKGLDPNVEMKISGVEWISRIPAKWSVKRTKALFSYGKGLPITKENLVEEGIPVISYGQIHSKKNLGTGVIDELIRFVPEAYINSNPESLVKKGDILVADTSEDLAGCGNAVYVDSDMTLFAGYHTIILKSNDVSDNKYIAYLMRTDAWRSQIRANVSGVKLFSISKRILNSTSVILPSTEEQKEITDYLDSKCQAIDEIIAEKDLLILELEKYKKSLIFDVVTGKKRVC